MCYVYYRAYVCYVYCRTEHIIYSIHNTHMLYSIHNTHMLSVSNIPSYITIKLEHYNNHSLCLLSAPSRYVAIFI